MDIHAEMDLAMTTEVTTVQRFTDMKLLSDTHKLLKDWLWEIKNFIEKLSFNPCLILNARWSSSEKLKCSYGLWWDLSMFSNVFLIGTFKLMI